VVKTVIRSPIGTEIRSIDATSSTGVSGIFCHRGRSAPSTTWEPVVSASLAEVEPPPPMMPLAAVSIEPEPPVLVGTAPSSSTAVSRPRPQPAVETRIAAKASAAMNCRLGFDVLVMLEKPMGRLSCADFLKTLSTVPARRRRARSP
jgi:hypothetical protein